MSTEVSRQVKKQRDQRYAYATEENILGAKRMVEDTVEE